MRVEVISEQKCGIYEAFLLGRPESLLYHSWRYQQFLVDLLSCRQETLLALDGSGCLVGALPLMSVDGPLGVVYNSMPFYGSNGGIICDDVDARHYLKAAYAELTMRHTVAAATLIENPLDPLDTEDIVVHHRDERIGQWTPLPSAEDSGTALMAMFHQKTRNMVRKSQKSGVAVEVDNDAFAFLVETHEENMREIGGPPKSRRFFDLVERHFRPGSDYDVYVAKLGTERIAALLLFYYNRTVEYFTPVVKAQSRDTQALSGVIFRAMTDAADAGYKWWNWGGTWLSQEGVYRFKSRWGTQDIPYRYFTSVRNPELMSARPAELLEAYPNFYTVPFSALARS